MSCKCHGWSSHRKRRNRASHRVLRRGGLLRLTPVWEQGFVRKCVVATVLFSLGECCSLLFVCADTFTWCMLSVVACLC